MLFSKYRTSEDIYFTSITQILANHIAFVNEDLVIYRRSSTTSVQHKIDVKDCIYALIDIYKKLNSINIYNIVEKSYILRSINTILYTINIINFEQRNNFIENLYNLLFNKISSIF